MDMPFETNYTRLCGTPVGTPLFSHSSRGQDFYTFPLEVRRLSGTTDRLNIILRQSMLPLLEGGSGSLCVEGQLRSFNNRRGEGARLVITVFARELRYCQEEDSNLVLLHGTLCKAPTLRSTPMGRDICDLMLAVNRRCGRSDYLPCICWGALAREASAWTVGTALRLSGRIQSRRYLKQTEEGPVEKTAFEVSAAQIIAAPIPDAEREISELSTLSH